MTVPVVVVTGRYERACALPPGPEAQLGAGSDRAERLDESDHHDVVVDGLHQTVCALPLHAEQLLGVRPPGAALFTDLADAVGRVDGRASVCEVAELSPCRTAELLHGGDQVQQGAVCDPAVLGFADHGDRDVCGMSGNVRLLADQHDGLPFPDIGEGVVGGQVGREHDRGVDVVAAESGDVHRREIGGEALQLSQRRLGLPA
ncbi:hypothetical protein [Microbacterium resistens]|uniref:hypothetical protein n=1 Tax=Microbacterium resistens TaxID=156977 RepID=UPI001E2B3D2C|nr:hypothetical protein [Microbacterium resistens]